MKKNGFTLAEVLITLGIIGVVAAMTIPILMQKTNDKEIVAGLKKFYSTMENAGRLTALEYGTFDTWDLENSTVIKDENNNTIGVNNNSAIDAFWDRIGNYLKIIKHNPYEESSFVEGTYLGGMARENSLRDFITFADGSMIRTTWLNFNTVACRVRNECGDFSYDVNGNKGPNMTGKDIFQFHFTKNGIKPMGYQGTLDSGRTFESFCVKDDQKQYNGYGCTGWVITNENLDYLKCSDLTWNEKTKCN